MKQKEVNFAPIWDLNPLWQTLTDEERVFVAQNVEIVHLDKNEIIHVDGEKSEYMWMLLQGKVRIYKEGIGQRQQIIRLLKPFDIFGYRAVIANEPYNSSASALEASMVYRMKGEKFHQLIRTNGALCYEVMLMMSRDLAFSEIQTVNLTQKHIRGRLAESILFLKESYGTAEDGCTLNACLSREDMANLSNMTTSNAIRTLSVFAQERLISIDGRRIKILDEPALQKTSKMG